MIRPLNPTEHQSSAKVFAESVDGFEQALIKWFDGHRGVWSGTATELIAAVGTDLWLQSPHALYTHLESHRQMLHSLGVDVLPHHGYPRMLSLRSSQEGKHTREPSSARPGIEHAFDPPRNPGPVTAAQNTNPANAGKVRLAGNDPLGPVAAVAEPGMAERVANDRDGDGDNDGHRDNNEKHVFENSTAALFDIVEMQGRIKEQGLDLKSRVELVADRTREIAQCGGVAVGLLHQDNLVYFARTGMAVAMAGEQSHTKLFRASLTTGKVLQFPEAQKNDFVGSTCRREGVKSLIVVPILHNRKVTGAMQLLFKEMRSFSNADVMTLELIADVVSEGVEAESRQVDGGEDPSEAKATEGLTPQLGHLLDEKASLIGHRDGIGSETSWRKPAAPESDTPGTVSEVATTPNSRWKAWMKRKGTSVV
jgi:putative methionine-R-sulfoxide reductase with GAF domain